MVALLPFLSVYFMYLLFRIHPNLALVQPIAEVVFGGILNFMHLFNPSRRKVVELLNYVEGIDSRLRNCATTEQSKAMLNVFKGCFAANQGKKEARQIFRDNYEKVKGWFQACEMMSIYLERLYTKNSSLYLDICLALNLAIRACKQNGSYASISRIIWLVTCCNTVSSSFYNELEFIPDRLWLPWIPQLFTILLEKQPRVYSDAIRHILERIIQNNPEEIYFTLLFHAENETGEPVLQQLVDMFRKRNPILASALDKIRFALSDLQLYDNAEVILLLQDFRNEFLSRAVEFSHKTAVEKRSAMAKYKSDMLNRLKANQDKIVPRLIYDYYMIMFAVSDASVRSVQDILEILSYRMDLFCNKKKLVKSSYLLKKKSSYLQSLNGVDVQVKMFSNCLNSEYDYTPDIFRFHSTVEVVDSQGCEYVSRISIKGTNGKNYSYVIVPYLSNKVFRQEARVTQLFSLLNPVLNTYHKSRKFDMKFDVPIVTYLKPNLMLVEDNKSSTSLLDIVKKHILNLEPDSENPLLLYYKTLVEACEPNRLVNLPYGSKTFEQIERLCPRNLLKEFVTDSFEFSPEYIVFKQRFTVNTALVNFLRYCFQTTEIQNDKCFIYMDSGSVVPTSLKFKQRQELSYDADNIYGPFRFSPNILEFIETELSVSLIQVMHAAARCFKITEHQVQSFLKTIWADDLQDKLNMEEENPERYNEVVNVSRTVQDNVKRVMTFIEASAEFHENTDESENILKMITSSLNYEERSLKNPANFLWM